MAQPHVDEIAGADRASMEESDILPDLAEDDGRYKFNFTCANYSFRKNRRGSRSPRWMAESRNK